jgi:hypothetical protein
MDANPLTIAIYRTDDVVDYVTSYTDADAAVRAGRRIARRIDVSMVVVADEAGDLTETFYND